MNPFTSHPHRQGIGCFEHCCFASGIACRLFVSAAAFAVHALFPFLSISRELDLEATAEFIGERNAWIETVGGKDADDRELNTECRQSRQFQ